MNKYAVGGNGWMCKAVPSDYRNCRGGGGKMVILSGFRRIKTHGQRRG